LAFIELSSLNKPNQYAILPVLMIHMKTTSDQPKISLSFETKTTSDRLL